MPRPKQIAKVNGKAYGSFGYKKLMMELLISTVCFSILSLENQDLLNDSMVRSLSSRLNLEKGGKQCSASPGLSAVKDFTFNHVVSNRAR